MFDDFPKVHVSITAFADQVIEAVIVIGTNPFLTWLLSQIAGFDRVHQWDTHLTIDIPAHNLHRQRKPGRAMNDF